MPAQKSGGGAATPKPVVLSDSAQERERVATAKTPSLTDSAEQRARNAQAAQIKKPVRDAHTPLPTNKPVDPIVLPIDKSDTKIHESGGGKSNNVSELYETVNPVMDQIPMPVKETSPEVNIVRTPTRNVTDISSIVPQYNAEEITQLLFENLSAVELSNIERHDTIEGIDQRYSIISNLSEIRKKYDSIKQLTVMEKFKPLTSVFTIEIQDKIPQEDYIKIEGLDSSYQYLDENNNIVTRQKGYYYIDTNGDLVIELVNLEQNHEIEVLIDTNGIIYKVEQ
jgi:hypothetical protein